MKPIQGAIARLMALAASSLLLSTTPADSQEGDVQGSEQMKFTPEITQWRTIEQTGALADNIRRKLEHVKLPDGFKISLYAIAPDATGMAVSPRGIVVFAGTSKTDVWAIIDRDKNRVADDVMKFASGFDFKTPSGLCFSKDGFLYVIEQNRVLLFPAAEIAFDYQSVPVVEIVPEGKLLPAEEAFSNQTARACSVGTDNKLHIWLDKDDKRGAAGIFRMDRDGRNLEAYSGRTDVSRPGTLFYTGSMFPERYRGGIFSAQPSSANEPDTVDAVLVFVPTGNNGSAEPFVIGRPTSGLGGRSAGLVQLHDGSILLSDGLAGAIYRISYAE